MLETFHTTTPLNANTHCLHDLLILIYFDLAIPHWRYWVGFEAVLALAFALLLAALPESIRWLLIIYKNDPNLNADCEIKARKIVKVL